MTVALYQLSGVMRRDIKRTYDRIIPQKIKVGFRLSFHAVALNLLEPPNTTSALARLGLEHIHAAE